MLPRDSLSNSFPNPPNYNDIDAFCTAAKNGDKAKVVEYLDQFGKDIINAQDNINARAITWAAWAGNTDIVELLLDRGAEIDSHGTSGKSALSWAAEMGRPETAALLLDRGASLEDRDDSGATPLDNARRTGNSAVLEIMEQWIDGKEQAKRDQENRAQAEREAAARAAFSEQLKKLKDAAPGTRIKIQPNPKKRGGGPGPRR